MKYYQAIDNAGREWSVPDLAVKEDYVHFLMEQDGLSYVEASALVKDVYSGLLDFWWHEQIVPYPKMVMLLGFISKDITLAQRDSIIYTVAVEGMESV